MTSHRQHPRILLVTPEVTFVPQGMGPGSRSISARAGGLGDICAAQIHGLYERGVDVHLAIPNYRNVFKINASRMPEVDIRSRRHEMPDSRIHLAQDRSFYYHPKLFLNTDWENIRIALAFQREVINRIIPEVQPDLIHCYDWMTGLIPAMARRNGIACLFTLVRLDSPRLLLSTIEERGIDAASFWQHCYFCRMPVNYLETRSTNPLDMLTSGVFASGLTIAMSQTFLNACTDAQCQLGEPFLKTELQHKLRAGNLCAVAPALDPSFNPATDRALLRPYGPDTHYAGKRFNKLHLQETLNLRMDSTAPVCFWPTRLDGSRPGCRLMADTLAVILDRYREDRLQVVFIADGDFQERMRRLIDRLHAADRAAVCILMPDATGWPMAGRILCSCRSTLIPAHCPAGSASDTEHCPLLSMRTPSVIAWRIWMLNPTVARGSCLIISTPAVSCGRSIKPWPFTVAPATSVHHRCKES
jgi:glycogen synthase